MRVLLATSKPFALQAVEGIQNIIEAAGHMFVKLENYADKAELLEAVRDVNALIVRSDQIDKDVIEAAPELKVIVRAGAGYDNVDLSAATTGGTRCCGCSFSPLGCWRVAGGAALSSGRTAQLD